MLENLSGLLTGSDGLEEALYDLPYEELDQVVQYVLDTEKRVADAIRSRTIPSEVEQSFKQNLEFLNKREKELMAALARPSDIKEYILPLLVSAYLVRDDPQMVGMILGLGVFGYENWRRSQRNRYLDALLDVHEQRQRLYDKFRQWESKHIDRARSILSQARMYYNALSGKQLGRLRLLLTENHRKFMRGIQERRLGLSAQRLYWTAFKRMEDLMTQYPAHRVQIYQSFAPYLDQYATLGGFKPVHRSLEPALESVRVSALMHMFRMQRTMQQLQDWNTNRAGMRGTLIGLYGSPSGIIQALQRGDLRRAVRTLADYQLLRETLETIKDMVDYMDLDIPQDRTTLIGYAQLLGLSFDPNNPNELNELKQRIQQQIDRLIRLDVRGLSGSELSQEFQRALLPAAGLPGQDIDQAIQQSLQNAIQAGISFWQQMDSLTGTDGKSGFQALQQQQQQQEQQKQQQNEQKQQFSPLAEERYLNAEAAREDWVIVEASSPNLGLPATLLIEVARTLENSPNPTVKAKAQAIMRDLGSMPLYIVKPFSQDANQKFRIGTGTGLDKKNNRNTIIVLFEGTSEQRQSAMLANQISLNSRDKLALDLAFFKHQVGQSNQYVYLPYLVASVRVVFPDGKGLRVPIAWTPLVKERTQFHQITSDRLDAWQSLGLQPSSNAQVDPYLHQMRDLLSKIASQEWVYWQDESNRRQAIQMFQNWLNQLNQNKVSISIVFTV